MYPFRRFVLLTIVTVAILVFGTLVHAVELPVGIIFDTDVDHDCDDIGALFILHRTLECGEVNLLATIRCDRAVPERHQYLIWAP